MKHLPNLVSGLRLVLTPYVCSLIVTREYGLVLVWFGIAAASDALDGWLARWLGVESKLGRALDPIADKALLVSVFLTLAMVGDVPWWIAAVVLGRDVFLLVGAGVVLMRRGRREFPPSAWGKLSTIVQMIYVLAVVVWGGVPALGWIVAGLAVVSGVDYLRRGLESQSTG